MTTSKSVPQARRRRTRLFAASVLAAAVGCSEPTTPTRTLVADAPSLAAGGNQRVKVKAFQLAANTLRIDGPAVTGNATISNSGPAIPAGVSIQGLIQQGSITRQAALTPVACAGSPDVGQLPAGNCGVSFTAQASNSGVGDGILAAGGATFVLRVIQTVNDVETELATKSVAVNLVGTPSLGTPAVALFAWPINGPSTSYTITLKNPASDMQGVFLRSTVVQAASRRSAAADLPVSCGGGSGVFPAGVCTMTVQASAFTSAAGVGPLVPGPALIEVQLNQTVGGTTTTFDTETAAIELVSGMPRIADLTLESTTFIIGGASVNYTIQLANAGFPATDVRLAGEIEQVQGGVTVSKQAGFTYIDCGAGTGVLPNTGSGTCSIQFAAFASTHAISGTLQPGPARLVVTIYKAPPNFVPLPYDSRSVDITLTAAAAPSIVSVTPASPYVVLDRQPPLFTDFSATITNPGAPLPPMVHIQEWIRQGTARYAAGGTSLTCSTFGTLPTGDCVQQNVISASNASSGIGGPLVPGDATFELELKYFDGTVDAILDTKTTPIVLVANVPSIVSISLNSTTLVLNGPTVGYTVVFFNPTGAPLTNVSVQQWIDQGTKEQPAGTVSVSCGGAIGELPAGSCVASFTTGSVNQNQPPLDAGPATFRLVLRQGPNVLATKTLPVTLVNQ